MSFVVEDGTGLTNATSLVGVSAADAYFSTVGADTWALLPVDVKEIRLNRGTQATCASYVFKGARLNPQQSLCFPRAGITDPYGNTVAGIPACVAEVVCEYALRAVTHTSLYPDPTFSQGGRAIKRIKQQAGPLQQDIEYAGPGDLTNERRYPYIDSLMCPWLIVTKSCGANGVVIAPAFVSGVSISEMLAVESNTDRYNGPFVEGKE